MSKTCVPASPLPKEELLRQLEAVLQMDPTSEATRAFHARALTVLDSNKPKKLEPAIEYAPLVAEHTELIAQGKSSSEISAWLSEKLGFTWAKSDHHGEFKTCSTPQGDLTRLKGFLAEKWIVWSPANGASGNHPEFYLWDTYLFDALFGEKNMEKSDERNAQLIHDWQALWRDLPAKEQYLKDKIGLDIKGDWTKLTGRRNDVGGFVYSDALFASGSLTTWGIWTNGMTIDSDGSEEQLYFATLAHLHFLG